MSRVVAVSQGARSEWRAVLQMAREQWQAVISPYLLQRTLLVCVVYFGSELIGIRQTFHALPRAPVLDNWIRWDSQYYVLIATDGYGTFDWGTANPFFPLFPALIVALSVILPKPLAALVVANGAAIAALGLLYAWIKRLGDEGLARRAVQVAIVFPTSHFLTAAYSESVYLVAAIGTVLAWEERKQLPAAVGACAACLARPVGGLAMSLPFCVQWLLTSRRLRDLPWFTLAVALGGGLVLAVYYFSTGDALAFVHSPQIETLGRYVGPNRLSFAAAVVWDEGWSNNLMRRLLNWSAFALVAATTVHFAKRRRFDLALITLLPVALPMAFQKSFLDAASMARYALCGFPIFLALARWAPEGRKAHAMDSAFQMVQLVLALCFATARWAE